MSDIKDLIQRAAAGGVTLRLALGADGVEHLSPALLREIQERRQEIVVLLAGLVAPGIARQPDCPRKLYPRPAWRASATPQEDRPYRGQFCETCGGTSFYRLPGAWVCKTEFPLHLHLTREMTYWSEDC